MSKTKFLTILVVLLLALNVATLYFLMGKRDGNKRRSNEGNRSYSVYISKKLNFDTSQQQQLKALRDNHKKELDAIRNEDRQVQEAKTQMLKEGVTDSLKLDSILTLSAINKKKFERAFYTHFMQIRALCRPDQLELFNQTLDEMNKRRMQGLGDKKEPQKK